jgi:hypothetical protein
MRREGEMESTDQTWNHAVDSHRQVLEAGQCDEGRQAGCAVEVGREVRSAELVDREEVARVWHVELRWDGVEQQASAGSGANSFNSNIREGSSNQSAERCDV